MKKKLIAPTAVALCAAFGLTACETPGQGAKHGAMIGAAAGALHEGTIEGAAVGAGIGAAAGALAGYAAREHRRDEYYREHPEDRVYRRDAVYYEEGDRYPIGRRTARPGFVISPYRPYHTIEVTGIPHGARVVDPSCGKIFINP